MNTLEHWQNESIILEGQLIDAWELINGCVTSNISDNDNAFTLFNTVTDVLQNKQKYFKH